jgi:Novel STAND NTPase 1
MSLPRLGPLLRDGEKSENPYVGPRALRRSNKLFGREREKWDLETLLIAERIVLLHAPSGAGKTSLIQAALMPSLEEDFDVSGPLRVHAPAPSSDVNPYLHSLRLGLAKGRQAPPIEGNDAEFDDWLTRLEELNGIEEHVLVLDQFEELVTLDPTDRRGQREFCQQVGEALKAPHRWALFSMREDYMGGLNRYLGLIPTQLRVRYRLDFLDREAAKQAAQQPARDREIEFTDAAADVLVDELRRQEIQRPGRRDHDVKEGFVEPVLLQVVCHEVWAQLAERHGRSFARIDSEDVEGKNVREVALGSYYANAVGKAARKSHVPESAIRRWFEEQLITARGYRSQALEPPSSNGGNAMKLLKILEQRYLIRGEERESRWVYELSHDALVRPIRADNRRWFRTELGPWEEFAWDWRDSKKDRTRLLRGEALREATRWLDEHQSDAGDLVREFVEASSERETFEEASRERETLVARARAKELALTRVSVIVLLLAIVVVVETAAILYLATL